MKNKEKMIYIDNMAEICKGENQLIEAYRKNQESNYHTKGYEVRETMQDQCSVENDQMILRCYTMNDIDQKSLEKYRIMFNTSNPNHIWRELSDKDFLEMLGGYRRDRKANMEGLTWAGLLMFGKGLAIRKKFDNIFMDYQDESNPIVEFRCLERVTYDGTWENNLFTFFMKVMPKLTEDLKRPFVLDHMKRVDDTSVHKAVREGVVNLIIHADYRMDTGVLKIIKKPNGFIFSNPGRLKLPREQIYIGEKSKVRNPHIQTMFQMIGFGNSPDSGFSQILKVWKENGWKEPELVEDTILNQITLKLEFVTAKEELEDLNP